MVNSQSAKGYFFVILASLLFAIFPTIQGDVLAGEMTPIAMCIVCNGCCCLFALIISLITRKSLKVNKRQLISLILIGIFGLFVTDYVLNVAYTLIPVGYVTMIHFIFPSIVCVVMAFAFKEGINWKKIAAIVFSIVGLALFAGGGFTGSLLGVIAAAITAVSYAFYMIANDKTPAAEVDPMVRVVYTNIVVTICSIIAATRLDCVFPTPAIDWIECVIIGLMLCMGIWLLTLGIDHVGAFSASFINMVEPIGSMIISAIFFGYTVGVPALIGSGLIIISMLFTIDWSTRKSKSVVEADVGPDSPDTDAA